ncbi:MAG: DNA polymerase I [Rhodospirillaceae bacterium]|nr:DNA polymerase I [Rhodospirillaceae bacterium]MBL6940907.1 DNA polymerase I [Rhodospirillales bacterium]
MTDKNSTPTPRHVFLIDGSGFLFRAYYGIKQRMTRADGTLVNAVHGFTTMLMKLIDDTDADHIAVIFDSARKTFRNDIYADYKANRDAPPDDLIPQFELVREATRAFNVACVDMQGFEADDLIATYAKLAKEGGADVTIVSSDKDLMQLVDDKVIMFDAMKNREIGPEQVMEKFGVGPDRVIEVQALAGDASDNVPGVPGIGLKTAALLINEFGDMEGVLAHAEEIKQPKRRQSLIDNAQDARISKELVTLKSDVPIDVPLSDFAIREPDRDDLLAFLAAQDFKKLAERVSSRYGYEAAGENFPAAAAEEIKATYQLVQDLETLQGWIAEAHEKGVVAVDTETTSLDATQAELVGVSLSNGAGRACYIPLAHKAPAAQGAFDLGDGGSESGAGEGPEQVDFDQALKCLGDLFADPSVLKVGHNIKYDAQVLANYGIVLNAIDDTMVLSYVLEGGLHGHGLDELALLHCDHSTIKFKEVAGTGKTQVTFDYVSLDKALDYAAEDADITSRLHGILKPRLVDESMVTVYETLERPLIGVLVDMERHGIKVDAVELKRLSADFTARLGDLEVEIHGLAGHDFNVGSPKQLGEVLFDEMDLPGGKKGKTGAYATGADVLEKLAGDGHTLPQKVLDWRQLAKLKSTYTDALIAQIHPGTGRVHTSYSMAGTSTGRLASSNPNLQNIPVRSEEGRKIRNAFIAEEGCQLLSADYSQIELRLLAHVAGIDTLIDAFKSGEDIHALTASQVFGVPVEGMDPMVRRQAKAINFGIIYGISAYGLARQLDISNGAASDYINAYFERYPGIRTYMEQTKEEARNQGYVSTLFGRKCHVRGIDDKAPQMRSFAERAAINAPIQGGAADIIKRAMIAMPDALKDAGLKAKMLLQVHDELIFEVPDEEIEVTSGVVKKTMENAASLDVPLIVDVGIGHNWNDAH